MATRGQQSPYSRFSRGSVPKRGICWSYHDLILLSSQSTDHPLTRSHRETGPPVSALQLQLLTLVVHGAHKARIPRKNLVGPWGGGLGGWGGRGGSWVQEGYWEGTHPRVLAIISTPVANFPSPLRPQFPHLYQGMVVLSADFKGL